MRAVVTITCTVLLVFGLSTAHAYSGRISIDTVEAQPGEHFKVDIWLTNNTLDIAGLSLPLRYASPLLTVDSVSFQGTILSGSLAGVSLIDPTEKTVRITYLPDYNTSIQPIQTTGGKVAELWLTLSPSATPMTIAIDSINSCTDLGGGVLFCIRPEISDASGDSTVLPGFDPGAVIVRVPTAVGDDDNGALPVDYELAQNYPNPFNPTTVIEYALPRAGRVDLSVYNLLGQKVVTLVDGFREAGRHQVEFRADDLPSGVYFYRLTAEGVSATRKMLLLK